jgi:REG-2-like HAD superfamily hydrolase
MESHMPPVRAILYDAGRTLIRPRPEAEDIWQFLARKLDLELPSERPLPDVGHFFYARVGRDGLGAYDSDDKARSFWGDYYIHALLQAGVKRPECELREAVDAIYDWYQRPDQWEPYPDVLATLRAAHERGFIQGVVSDWGTDLVPMLHAHDVTDHLDFVVASATMGAAKPHSDIFLFALARAELSPDEAVYVGDSYIADVLGARAVGMRPVLLDRERRAPALDCPVVTSLAGVLEIAES